MQRLSLAILLLLPLLGEALLRPLGAKDAKPKKMQPWRPAEPFNEYVVLPGHKVKNNWKTPRPQDYVQDASLPKAFSWASVEGRSYVTRSLNQHIPQYCGSCWAHGAMSAFADRIKIARNGSGIDVGLAIQYILNCGADIAGSCHGGSHTGTYELVKQTGFWPYDSCLNYEACSAESTEGICAHGDFSCSAVNTCRTCSTFDAMGGFCGGLDTFPNASIAEYGQVSGAKDMQKEIYKRGPIACTVAATPLHEYTGGIFTDKGHYQTNHIISLIGWGYDQASGEQYWIMRNSWGEYWGEMGYARILLGSNVLNIEGDCAWATPDTWTEHNFPCYEDGTNCGSHRRHGEYVDPGRAFKGAQTVQIAA